MALPCIICEIKQDIGWKSWFFSHPFAFHAPVRGSRRNIAIPFGAGKLECWGYPVVKKNYEDMCTRLDTIPACDRRTDRQTDGRTDGRTEILPRHSPCYAYASRGKTYILDISVTLIFDLLNPMLTILCPSSVDHLCQCWHQYRLARFKKYRVYKFGNRGTNERMNRLRTLWLRRPVWPNR